MIFNDDDKILIPQDSGPRPTPIVVGRVQLISRNNNTAPLQESKFKVMLELTGGDSSNDRPGLDLVAVLDVSGSMAGDKIEKVKTAMLFVIKKLSPIDRLSVVTFSADANRLCPLRQITENSQKDLEKLINGLNADGATNITAGLQTGLKVLSDRSLSGGRVVGIMLMSDGEQNAGGDAAQVPVGNVPVYTFGFGINHEPRVLKAIAHNSIGGTFSDVQDTNNLSKAFSQCLAGLLTVVVQDLKLTVTRCKDESTIEQVSAGSYPQFKDDDAGSVTVTFGDLYSKEVRTVIVDLLLPEVSKERGAEVLEITYLYSTGGKLFEAPPAIINVRRSGMSPDQQEMPEVLTEETRLRTARMIKEARVMADDSKLDDARDKLVEAQNLLEDVLDESNPLVEMLRSELQQLLKLMKSQEIYEKQGRPFALSSETCHDRQRFASRGDVESLRLYATPRMDKYLEQAKSFEEDPSKPLPSVDEDVKEELAANPIAPIAGAITFYIHAAIQSLQAIEKVINRGL
ncbi:E3 ubiquitin-protein ligase WAV3 [Ricinus communis]|uniref:Inter-alpha-trypsin inhibitor heavy chain H3, putative n=1 Tax=Ricinus communis TaxID=3988 RepID=B9S1D0_RICCO|nr:E3 ubiquitin-protein ligase WAV3 [Ricinus communis]EEF42595.1 Inter-alpha-trypsin inhibitor heavy chain H3 precursor, putative [Ricinus communis]|eukprot:XP_002519799.1 probable E3 ubiquitin-protein ligase EDA40 [Ricinus communis]